SNTKIMTQIVILGASQAGIRAAHRILTQAEKSGKAGLVKLTLVSPNTHMYWNLAAPRGLVPGQLTDEDMFQPIAPGLKRYTGSQVKFVVGQAESLDFDTKMVEISSASGNETLEYDILVLATGATTKAEVAFKGTGSTEVAKDAVHGFQARVEKAKTIVIAGAGPTGVEFAGELASVYGKEKHVTLLASKAVVFDEAPANVSKIALKLLQDLDISIKLQAKVTGTNKLPDGRQEITLADGEKLVADMYVPAYGLTPNASYVPARYVDTKGYVVVDEYLKVKGAENAWAIGDVTDMEPSQLIYADQQSSYAAEAIVSVLNNKDPVPYEINPIRMLGCSIGRNAGVGFQGTAEIAPAMILQFRKNLFMEFLVPVVDGSMYQSEVGQKRVVL
ncbi:Oxidoreductase, partial [Lachnellula occidentalis]